MDEGKSQRRSWELQASCGVKWGDVRTLTNPCLATSISYDQLHFKLSRYKEMSTKERVCRSQSLMMSRTRST